MELLKDTQELFRNPLPGPALVSKRIPLTEVLSEAKHNHLMKECNQNSCDSLSKHLLPVFFP